MNEMEDLEHFTKAQGLSAFLARLPQSELGNLMLETNLPSHVPLNNHLLERSRSLKKMASDKSFSSRYLINGSVNDSINSFSMQDLTLESSLNGPTIEVEQSLELDYDDSNYIEFYIPLLQLLSAKELMQAQVARVENPSCMLLISNRDDEDDDEDLYLAVSKKSVQDYMLQKSNIIENDASAYDLVLTILSKVDSSDSVESVAGSDVLDELQKDAYQESDLFPTVSYSGSCKYFKAEDPVDVIMKLSQYPIISNYDRLEVEFKLICGNKRSLINLKRLSWTRYHMELRQNYAFFYKGPPEDENAVPNSFIKLSVIDNVDISYVHFKRKQHVLKLCSNHHKEYYLLKFGKQGELLKYAEMLQHTVMQFK